MVLRVTMHSSKNEKKTVMKENTMGAMIAALRKEKGMTQLELAKELGVTDKAVSKWERDLSCPDISSIPKLAQVLGVSVDELMQSKAAPREENGSEWSRIIELILKAVPLAMGVALIVVSLLKKDIDLPTIAGFSGFGLFSISLYLLRKECQKE